MESNTHSSRPPGGLAAVAAELNVLDATDPESLAAQARTERILQLRRLVDRLEGHWLQELAGVDARGEAGADQGVPALSTAGWLRNRLRMDASTARSAVRTARALFRGPLATTAQALTDGEISPAHARVLAQGTGDLPTHTTTEAEPVLLDAARRLDPHRLRQLLSHLVAVADPDRQADRVERRHGRRGLWLAPTWDDMVAVLRPAGSARS
jgi:hypothetical protein